MWQNFDNNVHYRPIINQRILDQYIQSWNAAVRIKSKLDYNEKIKTTFKYEPYLDILANSASRQALTQLRICSHTLEIEFGRFNNTSRENRLCKLYNMKSVESEFHLLLCCPKYKHLRSKCLKKRYTT